MKNLIYVLLLLLLSGCLSDDKTSFELEEALINAGFTKIPIEEETTGHIILSAKINGINSRFMLDTGATHSVIDEQQKERLNVSSSISDIVATGAGKSDIPVASAENVKFEMNDLLLDKNEFLIMNLNHVNNAILDYGGKRIDGIIGSDILSEYKAVIDYAELHVYVKQNDK